MNKTNIVYTIVEIFHNILTFIVTFYAFIIPKNSIYDRIYIFGLIIVGILRSFYKDCPISYYLQKNEKIYFTNNNIYTLYYFIANLIQCIGIYIVCIRSDILSSFVILLFIFLKCIIDIVIIKKYNFDLQIILILKMFIFIYAIIYNRSFIQSII